MAKSKVKVAKKAPNNANTRAAFGAVKAPPFAGNKPVAAKAAVVRKPASRGR